MGNHSADPLRFLCSNEIGLQSHHLHATDELGETRGESGCRALDEEGPGTFGHPQKSRLS